VQIPGTKPERVIDDAKQRGVTVRQDPEVGIIFENGDDILPLRPCGTPPVFTHKQMKRLKDIFGIDP
jgi:hypothetical protein